MDLISSGLRDILSQRLLEEELSSRKYLAMSLWLESKGFLGAAKLWRKYSEEETYHADKIRKFFIAFGFYPTALTLEQPVQDFTGIMQIIALSYEHELKVTAGWNELAKLSQQQGDFILFNLACWFLGEQVEELGKFQNWLDRLDSFGDSNVAKRFLDNEMGESA